MEQRIKLAGILNPEALMHRSFQVTALRAVMTGDGRDLTHLNLATSAAVWPASGLTSFLDHRSPDPTLIGTRSGGDIIGVAYEPRLNGNGITCRYDFVNGPAADRICLVAEEIVTRKKAGKPVPNLGISPDATFALGPSGKPLEVRIWHSLDVVYDPATGAGFEELVRDALARRESAPKIFDLKGVKIMAEEKEPQGTTAPEPSPAVVPEVDELRERLASLERENLFLLANAENGSIQSEYRDWVEERIRLAVPPSKEDAGKKLATLRERFAPSPVIGNGAPTASVGPDGLTRLVMAAADMWQIPRDRLLLSQKLRVPENVADLEVERLLGIRELYNLMTGDREGIGKFRKDRMQFANVTTSTFSYLLQDAINVTIEQVYSDPELGLSWYEPIVMRQEVDNIETQHWVRLDSFDAAPTVSEGAAYTELSWNDIEETATWTKKGGYVGITLESILNNNGNRLRALAMGIAQAGMKAESYMVGYIFTQSSGAGPTMTETGRALFNATDGNYGTTALSIGQFWTISNAMANFVAAGDTSYSLAASNRPNRIIVPPALVETAGIIVNSQLRPQEAGGTTQTGNMQSVNMVQSVHPGLMIVECPEFQSDTNDYYIVRHSPPLRPWMVLFNLRGGRRPTVYAQDAEESGALFTNDEYRYKVRHWVSVLVPNWRQGYGSHV